ncbi:hypothetical protein AAHC03_05158 [Spirometra sp. Aus1]
MRCVAGSVCCWYFAVFTCHSSPSAHRTKTQQYFLEFMPVQAPEESLRCERRDKTNKVWKTMQKPMVRVTNFVPFFLEMLIDKAGWRRITHVKES